MSETETPARKSDLPARFAAGVVMIGVAIVVTALGGWPFRILAVAAAAVMIVEWADMHRVKRVWAYSAAAFLAIALLGGTEYLYPAGQWVTEVPDDRTRELFDANFSAFAGIAVAGVLLALASRRAVMGWGLIYIGIPSFAMVSLSWVWEVLVFWVFIVTWATDILAYFAGRAIGGPKLAPRISPNKTWAGLIGGAVGAGIFGWLTATWFQMEPFFLWAGAAMGVIAQIGDLYESWAKRRAGIKDSGSLLPGHGGVLDRLDGLLAVVFVTTILLMAGFWTA